MSDSEGRDAGLRTSPWLTSAAAGESSVGREPEGPAKTGDAGYVVSSPTARGNAFSRFKQKYGSVSKSRSHGDVARAMHANPAAHHTGGDNVQFWMGIQQVDRLDEPMAKYSPAPGRYESATSMMSGTTYVSVGHNPLDDICFELPAVPYHPNPLKNTDEGPLFRAYFSDAHSVLQTTSQIRRLIVSLNPHLRDTNAYLADRIAYHYATQVYKLEWRHPFLGINGSLESSFFHPFVCTWRSCNGIKAFSSLTELTVHMDEVHTRYDISKGRLLQAPDYQMLECKFCESTFADFSFLDKHVATHMIKIGQAFLDSSWRSIEADPGASLGIWQKKPVELDASAEPRAKKTPPPKEKFPYGGLFPRVRMEDHVPKTPRIRPQRPETSQGLVLPIKPMRVPESPMRVTPKKEKAPDNSLPSPVKPKDPVPEVSTPVTSNLPKTSTPQKPSPQEPSPHESPPQKPPFKQIGMATVEVKMVLSSNATRSTAAGGDQSDSDESEESSEGSEARDAEYGTGGTGVGQGWTGVSSSGQQAPWAGPSTPSSQGVGDGGDGGRRGKKRRKGDDPAFVMGSRPRFACPYRVFEPDALNCLEKGPKNPLGGCEDISRLKQHLGRRHKRSRRCNRCLKRFDNSFKARTHESEAACPIIPLPDFERLMDTANESITERFLMPMSEEDGWWFIFKILIPGMQDRDLNSLKLEYSPYYVHRGPAIMLPAMNFSASLLDTIPAQNISSPSDVFANPTDQMDLASDANAATSTFVSQNFSVPVFQVPDSSGPGNIPEITLSAGLGSFSGAPSDQSNLWTPPRSSTPTTTTAPSTSSRSASGSVAGSVSQTQLERNHMRLKSQYKQVEKENAKLREDKFANRGDLERVEAVLEEVLGSAELSQDVFENLSQVSDILMEMKRRLV